MQQTLPALEVEGRGAVVAAQEVPSFPTAIAGVVVGGPATSPGVPHVLPTPLVRFFGLRGGQQRLDLL